MHNVYLVGSLDSQSEDPLVDYYFGLIVVHVPLLADASFLHKHVSKAPQTSVKSEVNGILLFEMLYMPSNLLRLFVDLLCIEYIVCHNKELIFSPLCLVLLTFFSTIHSIVSTCCFDVNNWP